MNYYVYVLLSEKDKNFYVGFSRDIKERLKQHHSGYVRSTTDRRPLKLIYFEVCFNQEDALHREKYLKSTYGRRYIRNRLKNYLLG